MFSKEILEQRLNRIAEIIKNVEQRCMSHDGPVANTLDEMKQSEITEIYELADLKKIPQNLEQAIDWLKDNIPSGEQEQIANGNLNPARGHHTVGRWMRNNWGLWQGSELQEWFRKRGIRHADDMSGIILESFKRELQGEEIKLEEQIEEYRNYWKDKGVNPDEIGKEDNN